MKVSLEYCKDTLENNLPAAGFQEYIQRKTDSVKDKVALCSGSLQIEKNTFDSVLYKFRKSGKTNYDFLVKSGQGFQDSVSVVPRNG